jgi:hypothetical protein
MQLTLVPESEGRSPEFTLILYESQSILITRNEKRTLATGNGLDLAAMGVPCDMGRNQLLGCGSLAQTSEPF